MTEEHIPEERAPEHANQVLQLSTAVVDLIKSTAENLDRAAEDVRVQRRKNYIALGTLSSIIIVLLSFVVVIALQNHALSADVKRNSTRIVECTTPGQPCFNQTQEQLNEKLAFGIQDTLSRSQETINFILSCIDPASQSLCAKQFNARFTKIVRDALAAAAKGGP